MGLLRSPLDAVLGSTSKVKLLRALVPLTRPVSLREAARLAGVSPAGALAAMEELTAMGVMERREGTGQHLYTVNADNVLLRPITELFHAEGARWDAILELFRVELAGDSAVAGVKGAAVFGSRARGDDRPDSDLDLLVVTAEAADHDPVWERLASLQPRLLREFGLRLSPVVLSLERLRERERDGDPFVEAVAQEGIPVLKTAIRKLLDGKTGEA